MREVFANIDPNVKQPIIVVQHMPAGFTKEFAASLDRICPLSVKEAEDKDILEEGHVYIAPGDFHIVVENNGFGKYQIRSLYANCLEYRKNMARDEDKSHAADDGTQQAAYGKYTELFRLNDDVIRDVLFQCLLLDDLKIEDGTIFANLYTIYLLN